MQHEAHNLLVDGRHSRTGAVRADLKEAANLLLGDRRVVLKREAVRAQCLDNLGHARARLHRALKLLGVDREHRR